MKPIENLKAEHDDMLIMLDVLERMSEKLASGESIQIDHLKDVLKILQVFADKCHHGKEENYLYTAMLEAGVPEKGGPLSILLSEHGRGRRFVEEMKSLLDSYEKGESGCLIMLATPFLQYVDLHQSHIWKENNLLFPMAEEMVPGEKLNSLEGQFKRFENEQIGQGTCEAFRKMIENLSNIYLHPVVGV
jgi:hemerythrin-like domain-containing protein